IVRRQAARLHIAEFPKQFMLCEGVLRIAAAVTEVGPMIGMRSATTALILVAALAAVAFPPQPPTDPAAAPPPPAATPQPQKPAAAPAKPAATAAAPAAAAGDAQPALLGQYGDWGAYTASPGGNKVCFALAKPKTTKTEPEARK